MYDALRDRGLPVVASEANFVWLDVPATAVELTFHGERNGVVMRSFADVGMRLTIGAADENDRALAMLDTAHGEGLV